MCDCLYGTYTVKTGDHIAQLELVKIPEAEVVEVKELREPERSGLGFGSSGISHDAEGLF